MKLKTILNLIFESTSKQAIQKLVTVFKDKLGDRNWSEDILLSNNNLSDQFKFLGSGQHGFAFLHSGKVIKLTNSSHEFKIANKLKGRNTKCFAQIFDCFEIDGVFVITKKYYHELVDDGLGDQIGEDYMSILSVLKQQKDISADDSFTQYFKDYPNFIEFIKILKIELIKLGIKPNELDLAEGGLANNLAVDGNSYKIFDF